MLKTKQIKLAIIIADFNPEFTDKIENLIDSYIKNNENLVCSIFKVPGAVEIPYTAKLLSKAFDAIVAFGVVIKGETDHYKWVCYQSSYGCQKVSIESSTPVLFGILTCFNKQQALSRLEGDNNTVFKSINSAVYMVKFTRTSLTKI